GISGLVGRGVDRRGDRRRGVPAALVGAGEPARGGGRRGGRRRRRRVCAGPGGGAGATAGGIGPGLVAPAPLGAGEAAPGPTAGVTGSGRQIGAGAFARGHIEVVLAPRRW